MLHKGQRFRVTTELPVTVMTHWALPNTGGDRRMLKVGEEFAIMGDPAPGATAVYCRPVHYARVQRELVAWTDRIKFWVYGGYSLVIQMDDLATHCEPLER